MKEDSSQILPPGLYVVATPIGNLSDITLRALDTLKAVDVIACEDTRVSAKLLNHYGIKKPCISYNDHNGASRRPGIIDDIRSGKRVALISDAGTPLISDPGYKLVRDARTHGLHVSALPGASSLLVALCLSGLPSDRFYFAGFLPVKKQARQDAIRALAGIDATLVCFESAQRLPETLAMLHEIMGARPTAIARELTKLYEEVRQDSLQQLHAYYAQHPAKGEIVLVIGPPEDVQTDGAELKGKLVALLKSHSVKEAASIMAEQTGTPRKEIYALALELTEHGRRK
ncbi:MAG: 16S rRNA (cytidine(1402)-2'-O)-methyltransferase [Alphaproteobacteria bacterium]